MAEKTETRLTLALFVNRLNFLFNSVKIGPSRYFRSVMIRWSFSSCSASSAAVGCRGSKGGAIGRTSRIRFLRFMPSANLLGGLRISLMSPLKNSSRCEEVGLVKTTRLSRVGPNHARTSRGREENRPSTMANRRMGSVGARVSSMARTVDRDVSVTAAHQPMSEGM